MNPFLGVLFHWLGGFASGSFYVPYRFVRKWAWETAWMVGGFFSWIIMPSLLALLMTHDLHGVLVRQSGNTLCWTYFFGALWGLGGLTFGLTMRYLGMSLGMGVALGYCAAFGTLLPPIAKLFIPSIDHIPLESFVGEAVLADLRDSRLTYRSAPTCSPRGSKAISPTGSSCLPPDGATAVPPPRSGITIRHALPPTGRSGSSTERSAPSASTITRSVVAAIQTTPVPTRSCWETMYGSLRTSASPPKSSLSGHAFDSWPSRSTFPDTPALSAGRSPFCRKTPSLFPPWTS